MSDVTSVSSLSDQEWRSLIEPLLPIGERLVGQISGSDDPQLRHELYRVAISAFANGYLCQLNGDEAHPEFTPLVGQMMNLLGPNPDFMYYITPVSEHGIYKLSGYRGTVHMVVVQVAGGKFVPRGLGVNLGTTHNNYYLDDLSIGEDGWFEVILSPERPEGHHGDWWKLAPESTYVMIRQLSYDWLGEVDARFAIERLDTPAQPPRLTTEQLESGLKRLALWTEAYVSNSNRFCKFFASKGVNQLHFINFGDDGGMGKQAYLEGLFELEPDEALILVTDVPETVRYWSFHLTDERWSAYDWVHRQTILNGHTAKISSDGKFRVVISPADPGVHNWLDNLGYARGIIQGRWHESSSFPQPSLTKVKIADVKAHISSDTPEMSHGARRGDPSHAARCADAAQVVGRLRSQSRCRRLTSCLPSVPYAR